MGQTTSKKDATAAPAGPGKKSIVHVNLPKLSSRKASVLGPDLRLVTDDYVFHRVIGEGHYGKVRKAQRKKDNVKVAVKTIPLARIRNLDNLRREVEILKRLDHPNIIRFVDVYEDESAVHMITELCTGGELFDRIIKETSFTEAKAARITRQILDGVSYLHANNIAHRDLKPENVMFLNEHEDTVKICDFGLSRLFGSKTKEGKDDMMHTRAGTAYYMAPELLNRNYTEKCDVWSVGVILYVMLSGCPPFYGDNEILVYQAILNDPLTFPLGDWLYISDEAKSFIISLLEKDPAKRPTAAEARLHPWLVNASDEKALTGRAIASLTGLWEASKLKRAMFAQIAEKLNTGELNKLKEEFEILDVNKDGVLSTEEISLALQKAEASGIKGLDFLRSKVAVKKDFTLDWNAFIRAAAMRNQFLRKERVLEIFAKMDADRNGRLSVKEIQNALNDNDPSLMEEILKLDINHDGELDIDEFNELFKINPPAETPVM